LEEVSLEYPQELIPVLMLQKEVPQVFYLFFVLYWEEYLLKKQMFHLLL
jgi:hypothetical protein